MEKKYLQYDILSEPYKRHDWFEVLRKVFGVKNIYNSPREIPIATNELSKVALELGNFYTADERLVGVYEVTLKDDARTKLATNKVGLRNLLRSIYKYDVDGALIVFVQGSKWRFSYVSEIRTEDGKKETEPKRYTYLFGKGESCRTAAERFLKLENKRFFLEDLYDAFSVEKLNEDFFRSYKTFFENFSDHLAKEPSYRKALLGSKKELEKGWKDDDAKPIRDFAKKLLGRIVFLQFLQKKGWIAVPVTRKDWTGGDVKFLQTLFENYKYKATFHSTALKTLFFETLNTKRKDDIAPSILGNNIKIPYLNGGLFDKDISFKHNIDFPIEYFKDLLDFFEQYNFTIDENDPYDSEVGIDPEMLGHIFENLLEENREKGAFYTPKEIVHYMCQESLIEYLLTQLPNAKKEDIDLLVRNNKVADELTDYKRAQELNEKLKAVKVCDPAIGSGAFPMGLLKEIFECRRLLYGYLRTNETFDPAAVKKEIIQNNIYGVDRENGAVEIARLRFWLALVVDELTPQPLPNLDYKIMQGDSLLESFGGVDLSNLADMEKEQTFLSAKHGQLEIGSDFSLKKQTLLVFDEQSKERLYELINDYYNYDEATSNKYSSKQDIKNRINDIVEGKLLAKFSLQKHKVESQIEEKVQQVKSNKILPTDPRGVVEKKEKNVANINKEIESKQSELNKLINIIEHLHELQTGTEKPYFLWHLWFKDVFDKDGFDIVIGNPPYIQLQKMGVEADILEQGNYKTFSRTGDIYCLFFESGYNLLKPGGNLVFITSNSWLRTNYGKLLRKYFNEFTNPQILIDLSDSDIFHAATVRTSIFIFKKEVNKDELRAIRLSRKVQAHIKELNNYFIKNCIILHDPGVTAWTVNEKEKAEIISSVKDQGKPLKKWDIQINRGIITGLNEAYIIDEITKNKLIEKDNKSAELIAKILRGKDVTKYQCFWQGYYILLIKYGMSSELNKYPAILEWLYTHEAALRKRGQCNTVRGSKKNDMHPVGEAGQHHWLELDNNPTQEYFDLFLNPKILYPGMVKDLSFTYDVEGLFVNDKGFILTGEKLKYLVGVLNSKLFRYCFEEDFPELQGNSREVKAFVMKEISIKYPNDIEEKVITFLVDYILYLYDQENKPLLGHTPNNRIAVTIEEVLNMVVYELYFQQHMRENKLDVIKHLEGIALLEIAPTPEVILAFYLWLQRPENPIRNNIIAVDIKSPDCLSRINAATH
jgi:hypothetical protein